MRETADHDAFVRQDLIPDGPREPPHGRAAAAERIGHDLILKRILADAVDRAADLLDEAVAKAGFARFVVVLRLSDVALREARYGYGPRQGAG